VRDASVAGGRQLDRDRGPPRRARRDDRAELEGRVRHPGLRHAEGDRPDRGGVRLRAGRRAQPRLRRAAGRALDTPERKAAIEQAIAKLKTSEFKPTEDKAGIESVGDPFDKNTVSDDGAIAYAEAQFDRVIYDTDRDAVRRRRGRGAQDVEPAGVTVEFNGDAEFPPIEQGRRSCSACSRR
jgi:hypothetical protein